MASLTIDQAQTQLNAWLTASTRLSRGMVARVGDQRLDRADWDQVQKAITYWRSEVARLQRLAAGGSEISVSLATFPQKTRTL